MSMRRSSSHGDSRHHPADEPAGSDGQTTKQLNVEEEFRPTVVTDSRQSVTNLAFSNDTVGSTSLTASVDDDRPLQLLQPSPSAFLAPPPPPYPFHLCPSPYVTSFPPRLYPVRPRLLTPFDPRCCTAGFEGRLLDGLTTPPWRSGTVCGDQCINTDQQLQESVNYRVDVNKDDEDEDNSECDQIDVDTVDDPTPPSTAADVDNLCSSSFATHDRAKVVSGPTSDIRKPSDGLCDKTGKPGNSNTADDVIDEASRATKRKITQEFQDADAEGTKRRLETLLQLETHARRTIEENFQRIKEQLSDELNAKEKLRDSINRQLRIVKGSLFLELDHERKTRLVLEQQLKEAKQSLQSMAYGLCCTTSSQPSIVAWPQQPSLALNHLTPLNPFLHHPGVLHSQPPFAN